jgi:hypothetical protein
MIKKGWFCFIALFYALPLFAQLRVVNVPSGAAVVVVQSSAVFISWNAQSGASSPTTVVSEEGLFVLGDQTLGRVETFLSATLPANGTGSLTETLLIPPDIANQAFQQKAATFFYRRSFHSSADGSVATAALICRLSTSAYGNFSIASVTLFFDNQRGQETFPRNDLEAHAFAEIHYNGSGLLKAVWEVMEPSATDFRLLQQVNYHLTYGDQIVFRTPALPPLPTVVPGVHQLRFRIQEPVSGFEMPVVTYFVTSISQRQTESQFPFVLIAPATAASVSPGSAFEWKGKVEGCKVLKFSIYERASLPLLLPVSPSTDPQPNSQVASSLSLQNPDLFPMKGAEIFSAALQPDAISFIPREEQWRRLRQDVKYVWQVQALDASGKVIGESDLWIFQKK